MIWLSSNEGHLLQTNVTIRLPRINLGRVTQIFVITGWRFELIAVSDSRNQSVCMLQNTYFVEKKGRDEMDMCMLCHEEIPKMHKIPWGTSKNAQNYMRNFQKCTKCHEELPIRHKIPRGSSENAQNPMIDFK